jgi:hypothetical protein
MYEEPEPENEGPEGRPVKPEDRAREKSDEFRMHAELVAVFEGIRKFDARILPRLDPQIARDSQRAIGRLEKSRIEETPVVSEEAAPQAAELLELPDNSELSTNDYHIHRRPGEVMIIRWLAGEQVDSFYARLQAHFDAALKQFREDERQALSWKQDPDTLAYLTVLDAIDVKMPERYLREIIRKHNVFVLSTQSADEMDIQHLCDFIMGVSASEVVGAASAPPDQPTEQERAWFFKLFALRGISKGNERMCFFAYLQKSDDTSEDEL